MHLEQRLELIDSLPSLPAVKTPAIRSLAAQPTIDLSKPNATIGEEMMNLFMADIAEQNRKDVNNCKQLVQNAATKRYDPKKNSINGIRSIPRRWKNLAGSFRLPRSSNKRLNAVA